ncbi:FecR family protein [Prolixibacteraceae bacterium JC049]|nr:FecR family protein [Prolixibacteraceae bacterium JC049]
MFMLYPNIRHTNMSDWNNINEQLNQLAKDKSQSKWLADVKKDEALRSTYCKLKQLRALVATQQPMSNVQINASFQQLNKRIKRRDTILFMAGKAKYAAVALLLLAINALVFYYGKNQQPLQYTKVVADNGQISKVILPDSSIVWLNAGSTLTYNNRFANDNRTLQLNGQAYLNVTKDTNIPLIVDCRSLKVKVVGTKFDVSAYAENNQINVSLEEGCVELLDPVHEKIHYRMQPGEVATFDTKHKHIKVKIANIQDVTNWKRGHLFFLDAHLEEVVAALQRKFNIDIKVQNPALRMIKFNAKFNEESLEEIIKYIEFACKAKASIGYENNQIKTVTLK